MIAFAVRAAADQDLRAGVSIDARAGIATSGIGWRFRAAGRMLRHRASSGRVSA